MKLEQQVCTLEQAKKLKELDVKQTSLFYWIDRAEKSRLCYKESVEFLNSLPIVSAFSVAELGLMLPDFVTYQTNEKNFVIRCKTPTHVQFQEKEYEAKSRAAMIIFLIEKSVIKIDEVNQRLTA